MRTVMLLVYCKMMLNDFECRQISFAHWMYDIEAGTLIAQHKYAK